MTEPLVIARRFANETQARGTHLVVGELARYWKLTSLSSFLSLGIPDDEGSPPVFLVTLVGDPDEVTRVAEAIQGEPFRMPEDEARRMLTRRERSQLGPLGDADRSSYEAHGERQVVEHEYDSPRRLTDEGRMVDPE